MIDNRFIFKLCFKMNYQQNTTFCLHAIVGRVFCLTLLLLWPILAQNTNGLTFEHLSVRDGLPQATVQCILQDSRGFLWIGTQGGLARFDGYQFKNYKHNPNDPYSLGHNWINSLCQDKSGTLWIGTDGGLNRFDETSERFFRFTAAEPGSISILCILEDQVGTLWIGTSGSGLFRYHRETDVFEQFLHQANQSGSISNNNVSTLLQDGDGKLWVGTWGGGLNRFEAESSTFRRYLYDAQNESGLSNNWIRSIIQDQQGKLWIATEKGLNAFDPQEESFKHFSGRDGLSSENIWSLLKDKKGTLWVGTLGGSLNFRTAGENEFQAFPESGTQSGNRSFDDIFSLFEDTSGRIWAGSRDGLASLDYTEKKFRHYTQKANEQNSLSRQSVWAFCEDRRGNIWIGTLNGGLNKFNPIAKKFTAYQHIPGDPGSISDNSVWAITEDSKGNLWIGTRRGLNLSKRGSATFQHYFSNSQDNSTLSHNWVVSILEDRAGSIWIGTWGGGLNRFSPKTGKFKRYKNDPQQMSSLSHNGVWTLLEDQVGKLWVGTENGLNLYDPDIDAFKVYKIEDLPDIGDQWITALFEDRSGLLWTGTEVGLRRFNRNTSTFANIDNVDNFPTDVIHGIQEDDRGNLWFSTNQGIYQYNPKSATIKSYDINDGLQSNEFNGGAYLRSSSGHLYFGGINGFNVFHPDSIVDNSYVPPVVITSLKRYNLNDKDGIAIIEAGMPIRKNIELSYRDKILNFQFAALNFRNSDKNQYAYQLDGFNDQWIQLGTQRDVTFTNLDPGVYTLRVRGSNNDGIWNLKGASLQITIVPPWWQTWWFRLLAMLAIGGLATIAYKRRQATTRLRTELNAARDAQMSIMPHDDPDLPELDISGVCLPTFEVGGDFFDYLWLDENKTKFAIAIGDVSGKGMKAAMTAVMSSGMLHAKSAVFSSVGDILTHINKPIFSKTARTMFTAVLMIAIELPKLKMTFTNAGLTEPLLKSGGKTTYLQSEGMKFPLGGMQTMVYSETSAALKSGDILVLYSDGIPEAQSRSGEFYEFERLSEVLGKMDSDQLSAKAIKDKLLADVHYFARHAPQHDDITLVVVKVK